MPKIKKRINWKLEFGWRFWLPFMFIVIAINFGESRHPISAFVYSFIAVLTAEEGGKYIARKEAEQEGA